MKSGDLYVQAVDAIYAAGSGEGKVADALTATSRLLGSQAATYEVIDKSAGGLLWFSAAGAPRAAGPRYSDHFAALNPRNQPTPRRRAGDVCWDYKIMDERDMQRDEFYSEFLPSMGLRYFISVVLEQTADRIAVVAVQRARQADHVTNREIALMHRLCPHLQRAYTMRKLLGASRPTREDLFENALDLLADGIALLRRDGSLVFVNEALRNLAERNRDFRIDRDTIEFAHPALRSRFAAALGAAERVHQPGAAFLLTDFAVPRTGLAPYTVSVRPLLRAGGEATHPEAVAMLLVHDPLQQNLAAGRMLQDLYGLTNAEAQLVQALSTGMTAVAYAKNRNISVTTVYTHLRRTREKTGWKSVAELTRRYHELNVSLRNEPILQDQGSKLAMSSPSSSRTRVSTFA
jgi:DNA-binding CsgD family transcriptional regulator/PAS domain-containing protein